MHAKIAKKILGKKFDLSLAFIDDKRMRVLNKTYRKKDETTDILSFKLDKNSGEILISKKTAARKAESYRLKAKSYLDYLVIHGSLHLKGLRHGVIMEKQEKKFCKFFKITLPNFLREDKNEPENNRRHRHRHLPSAGNSSRRRTKS